MNFDSEEKTNWLKKLTLNKWSLTFAVIVVMLSAYLGLEEVDKQQAAQLMQQPAEDVLYVLDTLPYEVQKVSGANGEAGANPEDSAKEEAASTDGEDADNNNAPEPSQQTGSENFSINSDSDFFINYRLEREKARSRQLELLQSLIDDEKTTADMREEAQHKVIEQAEAIEQELMLESILVAKYGGEAVVFIQPEKVNVVLGGEQDEIADNEAEKIARLVDNYTGIGYENVIIVLKD